MPLASFDIDTTSTLRPLALPPSAAPTLPPSKVAKSVVTPEPPQQTQPEPDDDCIAVVDQPVVDAEGNHGKCAGITLKVSKCW